MPPRTAETPVSGPERGTFARRAVLGGLAALLVLLQVNLWTGEGSRAEVAALEARVAERRAENARLAEENARLEAEVRALKRDPASLERRARVDLGMIREGETFYYVLSEDDRPARD